MIPWYWMVVTFVIGCLFGLILSILMIAKGNEDHRYD